MQRLSAAKAKMQAALDKSTPKPKISERVPHQDKPKPVAAAAPVPVKAPAPVQAPQPVISTAQESVSQSAYQKAIASVL